MNNPALSVTLCYRATQFYSLLPSSPLGHIVSVTKQNQESLIGYPGPFSEEVKKMNKRSPSKELVRDWLKREVAQHRPPPDPKQIRRELGWDLVAAQRINRAS